MQRGILELTTEELKAFADVVDISKYSNTPLFSKLNAAIGESSDKKGNHRIELSQDEIERMLDEIGIPDPTNDREELKNIRVKITALLSKFQESSPID